MLHRGIRGIGVGNLDYLSAFDGDIHGTGDKFFRSCIGKAQMIYSTGTDDPHAVISDIGVIHTNEIENWCRSSVACIQKMISGGRRRTKIYKVKVAAI